MAASGPVIGSCIKFASALSQPDVSVEALSFLVGSAVRTNPATFIFFLASCHSLILRFGASLDRTRAKRLTESSRSAPAPGRKSARGPGEFGRLSGPDGYGGGRRSIDPIEDRGDFQNLAPRFQKISIKNLQCLACVQHGPSSSTGDQHSGSPPRIEIRWKTRGYYPTWQNEMQFPHWASACRRAGACPGQRLRPPEIESFHFLTATGATDAKGRRNGLRAGMFL